MSLPSAVAYIKRMRSDDAFRQTINEFDGSDAGWEFIKKEGFDFTMVEFKAAQDEIYKEYGITPL